jgi:hypothetical protein
MQIMQAVKMLTGKAGKGTLIKFDCMQPKVQVITVPARPGCICS